MVVLSQISSVLSPDTVSLYSTKDALLENLPVLIFYGPSTVGNLTQNGSRIQAHIFSLAGFQSFPRLIVSPSSPLYAAVYHLPVEQQGDEICRGLAVSLLRYFAGLSDNSKASLKELSICRRPDCVAPVMFDEMHAGELASRMVKVEDACNVMSYMASILASQSVSWIDLDIVLPSETIKRALVSSGVDPVPSFNVDGLPLFNYGKHDSLVSQLGTPSFLPTSKLRRAPSRPTAHSKSRILSKDQKISLRREMCEFVDTEERYVTKIHELVNDIASDFRQGFKSATLEVFSSSSDVGDKLFPSCLSRIVELNRSFLEGIQAVLQRTENEAIGDIEGAMNGGDEVTVGGGRGRDPTGVLAFAKEMLKWFPEFIDPYQDFMRSSTAFSGIINEIVQDNAYNCSSVINEIGEQRLKSTLIEPVQRLPRYSLFIDNMVNLLPASHPALVSLLKARDMITDTCALDTNSFTDNTRIVSCLKNLVRDWPALFSPRGRLISAMDVAELDPPFGVSSEGHASMLLLFPEALVLLQKIDNAAPSARGIIAEIDRHFVPSMAAQPSNLPLNQGLQYRAAMGLANLKITESEDGQIIWVTCYEDLTSIAQQRKSHFQTMQSNTRVFSLLSTYERKASRFCEDVTKARLEDRFPESLRESDKWALRTISSSSENLSVLAAIWEEGLIAEGKVFPKLSQIRVLVNSSKTTRTVLAEDAHLDIVACITSTERGGHRINIEGASGARFTDDIATEDVSAVLIKRCMSA